MEKRALGAKKLILDLKEMDPNSLIFEDLVRTIFRKEVKLSLSGMNFHELKLGKYIKKTKFRTDI